MNRLQQSMMAGNNFGMSGYGGGGLFDPRASFSGGMPGQMS
jgi:coiled-coil and C2 domain-containing protein 2A